MAKHRRTELVVDALEMTSKEGGPGPDLSTTPTTRGTGHGSLVRQEVGGGRHRPFDGKGGVSFGQCHLLRILRGEFEDRASSPASFSHPGAARTAILDYIEGFYNQLRRHSSLDYSSLADYEQATMKEVAVA